jgi:hypothetical protein
MKYLLLIHQGTSPTPQSPDEWATLSEDEQKAVYADYGCRFELVSPDGPRLTGEPQQSYAELIGSAVLDLASSGRS